MPYGKIFALISFAIVFSPIVFAQVNTESEMNDFPTKARAEYVFACMSANGQSEVMLDRCSCSIDTIAKIMTYEQYLEAETVLRLRQISAQRARVFQESEWSNQIVENYRQAQADAEIACF